MTVSPDPVRLLIADDDPVMRLLLSTIVRADPGLELVGEAKDTGEAIELSARMRPDVVLLDHDMPGGGGGHAATEIRARDPDVRVVALTAHESPAVRQEMADAGAAAYVVKGASPGEMLRRIREAATARQR